MEQTKEKSEFLKVAEELEKAKKATFDCLMNANCCVDMHGLLYWAEQVTRLRTKLKDLM